MAISTIVKVKRDGKLTWKDAAAAHSLEVAYEQGNFNLNIAGKTVNVFPDRGDFGSTPSVRFGDDQPMTFSFEAYLRDISDAAYATLEQLVTRTGYIPATWVPVNGALATTEVALYDLFWDIEGSNHADSADHQLILRNCWVSGSLVEGDPDVVTINGVAYDVYPEVT